MNNEDLYEYARKKNIIIEFGRIPKNKSLSLHMNKRDFIALDYSIINNSVEERTHLVHELGHCAAGAFYSIEAPLIVRNKQEQKAIRWSIRKYVPKKELLCLLKSGAERWEIAEHFNVTIDLINTACTYYFEYGITG